MVSFTFCGRKFVRETVGSRILEEFLKNSRTTRKIGKKWALIALSPIFLVFKNFVRKAEGNRILDFYVVCTDMAKTEDF